MGSQLEFLLISGGRVDRVVPGAGYVNPLTVLSMVEAVRVHKSNVFIHTAAWKGPSRDPAVKKMVRLKHINVLETIGSLQYVSLICK